MTKRQILSSYTSPLITEIKRYRNLEDRNKKDFSPTILNFGKVELIIPRYLGFCFGVENALEIIYKAIDENPGKKIYLLSEIIHNPFVNADLKKKGVNFIFTSNGEQILNWENLKENDIIVIPAFGTTVEIEKIISDLGLTRYVYNTTCPFVEKVWKKAEILGKQGFTILVHGKYKHEETRATFSHSKRYAPTLIVRDIEEVKILSNFILSEEINNPSKQQEFFNYFKEKYSKGFNPTKHLEKIAIVNQTTMLATETKEISDFIKSVMIEKYGIENINEHFADTKDTLCYATHNNQKSILKALESNADFAIVIGGYNSSNTSHIVELCQEKIPTYFISSEENLISKTVIKFFDIKKNLEVETANYIPEKEKVKIILTSGASCPDFVIDRIMKKILSFFPDTKLPEKLEEIIQLK